MHGSVAHTLVHSVLLQCMLSSSLSVYMYMCSVTVELTVRI